jgi:tRNA nucleotidyltransferase (CCA-adding enzyme)
MKTFVVGGAVRDALLGLPVQDRDWVVVGATPEDMLAQGFRPVGKDFPVFLHPATHEEYALARTERKTAPGYRGFVFHTSPDVKLEDDLVRRDLTINAIARSGDGALIDPFGGQRDLQAKVFRHVSPAFAEDPVRILRVARFAARLAGFTVAPETNALMRQMVLQGEVDALVPERVWQEIARGLMEAAPSRMLAVLRDCGALARIMPELSIDDELPLVVDYAAARGFPLQVRFAALMHGLATRPIDELCQRLKVPNECRELAIMSAREQACISGAVALRATQIVRLFEGCDAFRKPERFADLLLAAECHDLPARLAQSDPGNRPFAQAAHLLVALRAARAVNAGAIAGRYSGQRIPRAVHASRVCAVKRALSSAPRR